MMSYYDFMNEITSTELYERLIQHGMFSEKLPPVFTAKPFLNYCINIRTQAFEDRWYPYTVYENIKIPLEYSDKKIKNKKEKVMGILKELDLLDKFNKYPTELSGGQCQRIAIARALINEPKIILADEPTGALDKRTSNEVMNIFKDINKGGTTIILVTHDINIASQCHRIINIEDGLIVNDIKNS